MSKQTRPLQQPAIPNNRALITSCACSMSRAGLVLFSTAVLKKTVGSVSVYKGAGGLDGETQYITR